MGSIVIACLCWAFILIVLAARLIPESLPPWTDLDNGLLHLVRVSTRIAYGRDVVYDTPWQQSAASRVSLLKQLSLGVVLLLIFPYHSLSRTDYLIDMAWRGITAIRDIVGSLFHSTAFDETHSWRLAEYELWEVCVAVWVISFFLETLLEDQIRSSEADQPSRFAARIRQFDRLQAFVLILGFVLLVLLDNPLYRLLFELFVVLLISAFDLLYLRRFVKRNLMHHATESAQLLMFADIPATIAFIALLLFVLLNEPLWRSGWVTAFVSGASALNLLLATGTTLVLKLYHGYHDALSRSQHPDATAPPQPLQAFETTVIGSTVKDAVERSA